MSRALYHVPHIHMNHSRGKNHAMNVLAGGETQSDSRAFWPRQTPHVFSLPKDFDHRTEMARSNDPRHPRLRPHRGKTSVSGRQDLVHIVRRHFFPSLFRKRTTSRGSPGSRKGCHPVDSTASFLGYPATDSGGVCHRFHLLLTLMLSRPSRLRRRLKKCRAS